MKAIIQCHECGDKHKLNSDKFRIALTEKVEDKEKTTGYICEKCTLKILYKTDKQTYLDLIK